MGRIARLSLAMMLTATTCFSHGISRDTTFSITPLQLKKANLIFLDHTRLMRRDSLLTGLMGKYREKDSLMRMADSLSNERAERYRKEASGLKESLKKKEKELKRKKRRFRNTTIGYSAVVAGLLVWLTAK